MQFSSPGPEAKLLLTYTIVDLLEIEHWPVYNGAKTQERGMQQPFRGHDFFACSICLRIRSAGKFSNAMMRGKRGKLGSGSLTDRRKRFCIPCGIAQGRYRKGVTMQFGGAFGAEGKVCNDCGCFTSIDPYYNSRLDACGCAL